jgi:hypothetical protein
VVSKRSDGHNRALAPHFVLPKQLRLDNTLPPAALIANYLPCHLVSIHFRHLNVSQNELEHALAASFLKALLKALHSLFTL